MTSLDRWEQQPGGLYLAVSPFDKNNAEHRDAAISVMRSSIQTVAQQHGAAFNEKGFRNNMQAVYKGDLQVDLYLAKWELCERKPPICLGAAFGWETYGFTPDGQLVRSFYTEDVCILKGQLRPLIRAKPQGKDFPEESLAECLERINLQQLRNDGMLYRFGEVDRDNTTMMRQLDGNGANLGTGLDSAVLEYKRLPNNLLDHLPMDVEVRPIKRNGIESEKDFIGRWKEAPYDLRFIFTIGQATASGQRRVDIKSWHNGNLPEPTIRNAVINSSLLAIKRLIESPELGSAQREHMPSPSIPLLEPRAKQFHALYDACGNEVAVNVANRPNPFGAVMPDTHIFVQNDANMMQGFLTHGAEPRLFGDKPMIPGVNILRQEIRLAA
jgi:hypothetical protein